MKLSGGLIAILVVVGLFVLTGLGIVGWWIGTSNKEIDIRNQATAQQQANTAVFDKVWKTIQQVAGVSDQYASNFKEIYNGIMKERYQGDAKGAPLFKWIQEQNPNFSTDLYAKVSDAVESNRAEFLMVQKRLIDIKREHDNIRLKFPSSIVVGGRPALEIQIVTSTKTEKAFATGKDDDVDLYKKDSK